MKLRPTQFGVRENTASSRQHAPRLAVSPTSQQSESLSASEHEDAQSCERMPPKTETFNLSLTEPENGATGREKEKRVDGSMDHTRQIVWLGRRPEFEPLLACGDAARMLGNIHVKTLHAMPDRERFLAIESEVIGIFVQQSWTRGCNLG